MFNSCSILASIITFLVLTTAGFSQDDMTLVDRWPYGPTRAIAASGDLLISASGGAVSIHDTTTPESPTFLSSVVVPGRANEIVIVNQLAYFCCGKLGLHIVDFSDPCTPSIVFSENRGESVRDVALLSNLLVVAYSRNGYAIYDNQDPFNPQHVHHQPGGFTQGLDAVGDTLIVLEELVGLHTIALPTPSTPQVIATETINSHFMFDLKIYNDYAYICSFHGLQIVSLADLADPEIVNTVETLVEFPTCFSMQGNIGFLSPFNLGPTLYNFEDPVHPVFLGFYDRGNFVYDVVVRGDVAYMAGDSDGLVIVDISDPSEPQYIMRYDAPDASWSFAIDSEYIYIANDDDGVRILRNHANSPIVEIAQIADPELLYTSNVNLADDKLFASSYSGVHLYDISDPESPVHISSAQATHSQGSCTFEDFLLIANQMGVTVFDISDPNNPTFIEYDRLVDGSNSRWITIDDSIGLLSYDNIGTVVFEIDPSGEVEALSTIQGNGGGVQSVIIDNIAYIASRLDGLQIYDISTPTSPIELFTTQEEDWLISGLAVEGTAIALTDQNGQVILYNANELDNVIEVDRVFTIPIPTKVDIHDGIIYVLTQSSGIYVYESVYLETTPIPTISSTQLSVFPNPTNSSLMISIDLDLAGNVSLRAYDMLGREVSNFYSENRLPGQHTFRWSPMHLASGTYFLHLNSNAGTSVAKFTYIK